MIQVRDGARAAQALASRSMRIEPFGGDADGELAEAYVLTNAQGMQVRFVGEGGAIVSILVPDRAGELADVALGHDSIAGYAGDDRFLGALIGRYANRIRGSRFTLDGVTHLLPRNDGAHHLHGGPRGFHRARWRVEPVDSASGIGAVLRHTSADGEEGYPGTVEVRVGYMLTDENALVVDYHATTDRATPLALTQHSYFNLAGHEANDVLLHELTVRASRFTPVDAELIPTGELRDVRGTPFDFTSPRAFLSRLDAGDEQLRHGGGYDHNFVLDVSADGAPDAAPALDDVPFAARLHDPVSGRTLDLYTTEPGLQVYTANTFLGVPRGKGGACYGPHAGVALEPQRFPDSPNQPQFPSAILRSGEVYRSRSIYRFSVR